MHCIKNPRDRASCQDDLVALRKRFGVDRLTPDLTGWAQVNGRDALPIPEKVRFDAASLQNQSLWLDVKIMCLTLLKVVRREGVTH